MSRSGIVVVSSQGCHRDSSTKHTGNEARRTAGSELGAVAHRRFTFLSKMSLPYFASYPNSLRVKPANWPGQTPT